MAFIASPPPHDNGRDSAANPFDLMLDRANDDFPQIQPAAGEPFVDHLAYGRFHLEFRGAMRLIDHPAGPLSDTHANGGGDSVTTTARKLERNKPPAQPGG